MGNNAKLLIATLVGTLVLVVGVSVFFSQGNTTGTAQSVDQATLLDGAEHVKGPQTAKVTIVEFADFQCPACAATEPVLAEILESYPEVRLVFRHFPLLSIHRNALASGQAAEAAAQQGKFWEMHDALYRTQEEWQDDSNPQDAFVALARELQLDETAFIAAYESSATRDKVYEDLRLGENLKVNSTPTLYYNGEPMDITSLSVRLSEEFPEVTQQLFDEASASAEITPTQAQE